MNAKIQKTRRLVPREIFAFATRRLVFKRTLFPTGVWLHNLGKTIIDVNRSRQFDEHQKDRFNLLVTTGALFALAWRDLPFSFSKMEDHFHCEPSTFLLNAMEEKLGGLPVVSIIISCPRRLETDEELRNAAISKKEFQKDIHRGNTAKMEISEILVKKVLSYLNRRFKGETPVETSPSIHSFGESFADAAAFFTLGGDGNTYLPHTPIGWEYTDEKGLLFRFSLKWGIATNDISSSIAPPERRGAEESEFFTKKGRDDPSLSRMQPSDPLPEKTDFAYLPLPSEPDEEMSR